MTKQVRHKPYVKMAELTRSNTTATMLFTLPRTARILSVRVINAAAAAGATISLGTVSSSAYFVSAASVATAGGTDVQTTANCYAALTSPTDVYGLIAGGAIAGGPFLVCVEFVTLKDVGHI